MPKSERRRTRHVKLDLAMDLSLFIALALALCWVCVRHLDPAFAPSADVALAEQTTSASVMLNAIPATLIAILLLALTRRGLASLSVVVPLLLALYTANEVKLELLDTPLLPGDFQLLAHLGDSGALLARYLTSWQWAWVIGVATIWLLLLLFERPWSALRGHRRLTILILALLVNGTLFLNIRPWSTVYAAHLDRFETWSPSVSTTRNGLVVTLLNYAWRIGHANALVDRTAAARILHAYPLGPPMPKPSNLPDIIVLQSESLFDPQRLVDVDAGTMLPNLHRLMQSHRHGDLWVPAFGGGTIRTEFEVLTGLAMREFPEVEYPYFSLTAASDVPSLASVLGGMGYRTIAMHPNSRDFWNRAAAFERLGFDEFDAIEQFAGAGRIGYYISDEALVDRMLARLAEASGPTFLFAISMENHGPYDNYPNADPVRLAAQPVPSGLNEAVAARLRGYFYHLEIADRQLARLVEALRERSRPSILLFYGDHLPALPKVYSDLGFDDGGAAPSQPVPWLLVDSRGTPALPVNESSASFYLPGLLLDAAGIDDRGYFHLLELLRRVDVPRGDWTPPDSEGMRAVMQLRHRGHLQIDP
ncbi:MAG: LTA synthase family protein [Xanthomonadales bacterium]|nr:LTA synthase family protein [Xanthomonadales bacterium]